MIIQCGYKNGDYCKCYRKSIEEAEANLVLDGKNMKCCDTCPNKTEIFTEKDKVRLLYDAYKWAGEEKSAYQAMYMRGIYGHDSVLKDDFGEICYYGYGVWLYVHKKYRYLREWDKYRIFRCMQLMNMRIPKRIRREMRRIKKNIKKGYYWWCELEKLSS